MKKHLPVIVFFSVIIWLLLIDLLTKEFVPTVVKNTGIAWGFMRNSGIFLAIFTVILTLCAVVLWWFYGRKSVFACVAFGTFIAGAIGNIYDRIVFGYVRDFISMPFWSSFPIFNFADMCLTIGTGLLVYWFLFRGKNA